MIYLSIFKYMTWESWWSIEDSLYVVTGVISFFLRTWTHGVFCWTTGYRADATWPRVVLILISCAVTWQHVAATSARRQCVRVTSYLHSQDTTNYGLVKNTTEVLDQSIFENQYVCSGWQKSTCVTSRTSKGIPLNHWRAIQVKVLNAVVCALVPPPSFGNLQ